MPKRWLPILPVMLVLLGTAGVFAWPWLQGRVYADFDLQQQFLPWRVFYAVALDRGESAIWNPFLARGYDHLAEGQSGLLHPLHWAMYRVLPLAAAVTVEMLGHLLLAGVGMYFLLRRVAHLVPLAAWIGAGLFAGNVFFYAHFMHVNMLWVYAHLPWLLWAVAGCGGARRGWAAMAVGLCVASMWLLGHPQTVWYVAWGAALAVALWGLRRDWDATWRRALGWSTVGALGGTLIGLAQLLPTAVALMHSPRGTVTEATRENFSLHPFTAVLELAPAFLRDRLVRDLVLDGGVWKVLPSSQELPAYLGLGVLTVLLAGALLYRQAWWAPDAPRRGTLLLAAAGLVMLLLALGRYGGLNALLGHLPLVAQFRNPARYLCLLYFYGAAGVAWVVHRLLTAETRPHLSRRAWLLLTLPAVGALLATLAAVALTASGRGQVTIHGVPLPITAELLPLLAAPLVALAALALLAAYLRTGAALWLGLLGALCIADLTWHCRPFLQGVDKPVPTRPLADLERARRAAKTADHTYRHLAGMNDGLWEGQYLANGYLGIGPAEPLHLEPTGDPAQLKLGLQLAAVAYIHTKDTATGALDKVINLPDPWSRLRLVQALGFTDQPLDGRTLDATNTAVTTAEAYGIHFPVPGGFVPLMPDESATFVDDGFSRIVIDVKAKDHPRVLVLADRYDSGWQCTIDGKGAHLFPLFGGANRGLVIGGTHRVVLTYHSRPLEWGLGFAALGGLVLIGLGGLQLRRGRAWHSR